MRIIWISVKTLFARFWLSLFLFLFFLGSYLVIFFVCDLISFLLPSHSTEFMNFVRFQFIIYIFVCFYKNCHFNSMNLVEFIHFWWWFLLFDFYFNIFWLNYSKFDGIYENASLGDWWIVKADKTNKLRFTIMPLNC